LRISPVRSLLVASWLVSASGLPGCAKKPAPTQVAEAGSGPTEKELKESLAGLEPQLEALRAKFSTLGTQIEAISPDTPGFGEVRAKFYATDEGMGVMWPKLTWLSAQLDSALKSNKRAELQQVSKDIARTYGELGQIDRISLELLHQVLHLQRMAPSPSTDAETHAAEPNRGVLQTRRSSSSVEPQAKRAAN